MAWEQEAVISDFCSWPQEEFRHTSEAQGGVNLGRHSGCWEGPVLCPPHFLTGAGTPSALGSSLPSATQGPARICWERHSGNNTTCPSGKRRPSAVSQFLWPPESQRTRLLLGTSPGSGMTSGKDSRGARCSSLGSALSWEAGILRKAQCHSELLRGQSQEAGAHCVFTLNHFLVERCPSRRRLGGLGLQAGRGSRNPSGWAEAAWPHPQGEVVEITQWCQKQVISSMKGH